MPSSRAWPRSRPAASIRSAPEREAKQQELNAKLREFKTRQIEVIHARTVTRWRSSSRSRNRRMSMCRSCLPSTPPRSCPRRGPSLDELGKALSDPKLDRRHVPHRRPYRRQGQRRLQSRPVAAARGVGEGVPGRDLPGRRRPPLGDRLRRGAAQEQGRSARRREPPGADRQYRKRHCGRRQASAGGRPRRRKRRLQPEAAPAAPTRAPPAEAAPPPE